MLFSTPVFLFAFLPIVLALYWALGRWVRNAVLLAASLLFYAWGEGLLVAVMIGSILANYAFGLWVERARASGGGRLAVGVAVAFNLALLVFFKYANWLWENISGLAAAVATPLPALPAVHLPIGISFFTFQAMSYVIDVYRRDAGVQRNPVHFGVYIALFPQLIAGPIVRYKHVAEQILERAVTCAGFAYGVRRFTVGLAKKLLVADVVALPADEIFALAPEAIGPGLAWLGIVCYTLQIYFDFSGYSDMAIGLGRMFGFRFLENFDYPYVSRSIAEFWRRWHISLSSWFRDYLYIPLGGNRVSPARTYSNLVTVFFLCGLWHGASWSFVVWGLYHGVFLVLERVGLGAWLERMPRLVRHAYVLAVVMVGWVFFRAEDLGFALGYVRALAFLGGPGDPAWYPAWFLDSALQLALAAGALGSIPWVPRFARWAEAARAAGARAWALAAYDGLAVILPLALLFGSALQMTASTYSPFIYFRF